MWYVYAWAQTNACPYISNKNHSHKKGINWMKTRNQARTICGTVQYKAPSLEKKKNAPQEVHVKYPVTNPLKPPYTRNLQRPVYSVRQTSPQRRPTFLVKLKNIHYIERKVRNRKTIDILPRSWEEFQTWRWRKQYEVNQDSPWLMKISGCHELEVVIV